METGRLPEVESRTIALRLARTDFDILEKFRGELSHDAFVTALLRMIDSGAVMNKPEWVREHEKR